MDRISILIADDEETVVETLAAVVAAEPDLEVVASANDAGTAIELASREQPDVAASGPPARSSGDLRPRTCSPSRRTKTPPRSWRCSAPGRSATS